MTLPTVQNPIPSDMIDLGLGDPNPAFLPVEALARAAQERLQPGDSSYLQYGIEQGDGYFRLALAQFLSRNYVLPITSESLFITNGVSSALALLCTCFTQAGDTIFVEEPTYFLALKIFADYHLKIVPIPMDESGLNIDALKENLTKHHPKFLYTIPIHHNPSGITLTEARRAQLIKLTQQYHFLLIADEVYQLLTYNGRPPRPFAAYINIENIISLGSFSKILAPGLRLGWIQAHPRILQRLIASGQLDSGGGMNPFTSAIVRGMIEAGNLDTNLQKLINTYRRRLIKMDSLLTEHLPALSYAVPQGGYFFWVGLPDSMDAVDFRNRAKLLNVGFRPGTLFSCAGGLHNYIRLCFAYYDEEYLEQGILRLKECFEKR